MFKAPITDSGKKSKKGKLSLEEDGAGGFITKENGSGDPTKVGPSTPFPHIDAF